MDYADYPDLQELNELEELIRDITEELNKQIDKETELELILIAELKIHSIKDTLSQRNKFIELRNITRSKQVEDWVDEWIRTTSEIKQTIKTLNQVQGKRDSKKLEIKIKPN